MSLLNENLDHILSLDPESGVHETRSVNEWCGFHSGINNLNFKF